jgi:hypothetical protein
MHYSDYKLFVQNMTKKIFNFNWCKWQRIGIYILPIIVITRYLTRVLPRVKYFFSQQKNFYIGFFDMFLQLKKF